MERGSANILLTEVKAISSSICNHYVHVAIYYELDHTNIVVISRPQLQLELGLAVQKGFSLMDSTLGLVWKHCASNNIQHQLSCFLQHWFGQLPAK